MLYMIREKLSLGRPEAVHCGVFWGRIFLASHCADGSNFRLLGRTEDGETQAPAVSDSFAHSMTTRDTAFEFRACRNT